METKEREVLREFLTQLIRDLEEGTKEIGTYETETEIWITEKAKRWLLPIPEEIASRLKISDHERYRCYATDNAIVMVKEIEKTE